MHSGKKYEKKKKRQSQEFEEWDQNTQKQDIFSKEKQTKWRQTGAERLKGE